MMQRTIVYIAALLVIILPCGYTFGFESCDAEFADAYGAQMLELDMEPVCVPAQRSEKYDKVWPVKHPARRKGVLEVRTTLVNLHTDEQLPVFKKAAPSQAKLRYFFRCRGFGYTIQMAPVLLESIFEVAAYFEATRVSIISGYRSDKFNNTLLKKGRNVAQESKHTLGQAVDFRLDSVEAAEMGKWLRDNHEGGVGTYVNDNFVHIDAGAKRAWYGN